MPKLTAEILVTALLDVDCENEKSSDSSSLGRKAGLDGGQSSGRDEEHRSGITEIWDRRG